MTFLEAHALLDDTELAKRITVAVFTAAAGVFTEAPTAPDHAARLEWAKRALSGDGVTERRIRNFLVTRQDPQAVTATDETLLTFVEGLVTPLAKLPA